jgi:hypothetical protein
MLTSTRIALAIMFAGVALYVGSMSWLATRKLVPLDIPISLSRGQVRTEQFGINLDSGYHIQLEVDGGHPVEYDLECVMWGCNGTPSVLQARWTLFHDGKSEASGGSEGTNGASGNLRTVGRVVGYFASSGGRYRLDVDVLSDTDFLNVRHPRLRIQADGNAYDRRQRFYTLLPFPSGLLVAIGGTLLLLSRGERNIRQIN